MREKRRPGRPRNEDRSPLPDYEPLPPSKTPEEQEKRMISLAMDLAERQLREGTAPAAIISRYLRIAELGYREQIENLRKRNELLEARAERERSAQRADEVYEEALKYLRRYSGEDFEEVEE